jgi:hypothetical protein
VGRQISRRENARRLSPSDLRTTQPDLCALAKRPLASSHRADNVKLLLPPRQSRATSLGGLGRNERLLFCLRRKAPKHRTATLTFIIEPGCRNTQVFGVLIGSHDLLTVVKYCRSARPPPASDARCSRSRRVTTSTLPPEPLEYPDKLDAVATGTGGREGTIERAAADRLGGGTRGRQPARVRVDPP